MVRPMEELVSQLRDIVGERWCYTAEHQLRTYESDGLLQYAVRPGVAVLPGTAEEVRDCVRACAAAGAPWVARGSGSGLSGGALPLAGRRPHRHVADEARARDRPRQPARARRARGDEHRRLERRGARLLLPARPELADRLLDRRQRGGELRRRALLQVRLHHELRLRPGGRAPGRRDDHARRPRARPARLRPARRVRRLGGHARDRHEGVAARDARRPRRSRRSWRSSTRRTRRARRSRRSCSPASCPARSR